MGLGTNGTLLLVVRIRGLLVVVGRTATESGLFGFSTANLQSEPLFL